jgi:nucleotide-binding universal stress UspA family protein
MEEAPYPCTAENDAVIRVHAAGFTPGELDWPSTWKDRAGLDRGPVIPGHEVSGEVAELGMGTTGLTVGQRAFGLTDWTRDGALAEYVGVEARNLAPLPAAIDYLRGAALPMPGLTAWQALFDHAGARPGQTRRGARPDHRTRSAGSGSAEYRHPILARYDGSNASRHALAYAAGMARRLDGWLVVVHVWWGDGFVFVPLTERMRWLRTDLADAGLTGLDTEMIVRFGRPARELRRGIAERGADALVTGAPGRFLHWFAGSVPAWLAGHAECAAVIVP